MHLAIDKKSLTLVELLLKYHPILAQHLSPFPSLQEYAKDNNASLIIISALAPPTLNTSITTKDLETFVYATRTGNIQVVTAYLKKGLYPSCIKGNMPLLLSTVSGLQPVPDENNLPPDHVAVMQALWTHGALLTETTPSDNNTVLMLGANSGNVGTVTWLCQ